MKIKVSKVMKAKTTYSSQRETVVTSSFRACSLAMDDGGRCLLDVINDPKLLQSFLESGSDENSKDLPDGSSESAAESPQVSRSSHISLPNHVSSAEHIVDQTDQMGYTYAVDGTGLLAQSAVGTSTAGLGGMSLVVASTVGTPAFQHAATSATIHHLPTTVAHSNVHPHSPASARSATPHSIKSPSVGGPSSVHSMPPPSPLQQTRSPLPSHTPSPSPAWSPVPHVMSPVAATSRSQPSMPSVAFPQSHNQIIQTSGSVPHLVTALAAQQSITQKLTLQQQQQQQQQQLFLQHQIAASSQQPPSQRITGVPTPVVTTTVVQQPMVQLIPAPQGMTLSGRTSHATVRPIQPKQPPQILPKPATCTASNQFISPAPAAKQAPPPPVTTAQRTVGVGLQPAPQGQLVIGQPSQPGMFAGPHGTILLNQIIPGLGQGPGFVIQGNLGSLPPGVQLTLARPNSNSAAGQSLNISNPQNNATLIAALQSPSQHAQTLFAPAKSPIPSQQTIVIPNNIAHAGLTPQNINLTSAGIPNSGLLSSSTQGVKSNSIILQPSVIGPNQRILQQIQTPNGPILAFTSPGQAIAVPHLPAALGNPQLAPVTVPMHSVMTTGQGVLSGFSLQPHAPQSALQQQQSIFGTAVPFTSHVEQSSHQMIQVPQPLASPQLPNHPSQIQPQQVELSPKPASPPKESKGPNVNLEAILKETGIYPPEHSPLSHECHSPIMDEPVPPESLLPQQLITALQSQQVLLDQNHPGLAQIKLALAHDGSVIVHPHGAFNHTPRVHHYVSSGQVQARTVNNSIGSVILPTMTTAGMPVPVCTAEPSHNHSNLIARLNAGPAISVPEMSPLDAATGIATPTTMTSIVSTCATTLVPLTVHNVNSHLSSSYVVQRTNHPIADRMVIAEDVHVTQSRLSPAVASTSPPVQNVQNRINHANSMFQTLLVPKEHVVRAPPQVNAPKTVHSPHVVGVTCAATVNSQVLLEPQQVRHNNNTPIVEVVDSSCVTTSRSPSDLSNVPNVFQKVQKEISELGLMKNRCPEQQKVLQQLVNSRQKLPCKSKLNKTCPQQVQFKMENDVDKLVQRAQATYSSNSETPQQLPIKAPVSTAQQSGQSEKPQNVNSKALNSHSLHLVNLLKPNSSHSVTKHPIPATTTVTAVCDSTSSTKECTIATNQKLNQVLPPIQPRLQTPTHTCSKVSNEVSSHQVIVRLQKPVQQSVQTCPTVVQIKPPPPPPPPVKKVVNAVPKSVLFNDHLLKSQNGAVNPDVKTPFSSKQDACSRLLSYHVYNSRDPSVLELEEADYRFDETSKMMLEQVDTIKNKYRMILLKDSMKSCANHEEALMNRLFVDSEQESLDCDRAAVAEGKSLSLPPLPHHWLHPPPLQAPSPIHIAATVKEEKPDDLDCPPADPPAAAEESSHLVYKEDDNLEAPVIDSCEDIVPCDDNSQRSPPTLKRIVLPPAAQEEDPPPCKKKVRLNLSNGDEWDDVVVCHAKSTDKGIGIRINHKYPLLTRDTFHSDSRIDVSDLGKDFDMSPMEIDPEADGVASHLAGFDPGTDHHLADFDPSAPRTDESHVYSLQNNCADKYDFDLLVNSDWSDDYVQPSESEAAAVSLENNNHDPHEELDLSSLDGLGEHLDDSPRCIPNGIPEGPAAVSNLPYIGYIPKDHKRFLDSSVQSMSNCSHDQVQNAIKSIIGTSSDDRYDSSDYLHLSRHGHNSHLADYSSSLSADHSSQRDVEAAVNSILL